MIPVIIPHYKKKIQLEKAVNHLRNQTVPVEIFVRDNNEDNIHFTAAINEGITKYLDRNCKYILIVNQDMYLQPTAAEEMLKFMDSNPKCGIGAPLQLDINNPDYVIWAGGYNAFPVGKHQHGLLSEFTENQPVLWANGACMILRKKMIQEIGLLDNNFILIGSDSDYCFTARSRGWQVFRIARARGIHEFGVSRMSSDEVIENVKAKDMIYFAKKWLTGQLYKTLAYEGEFYNTETIAEIMDKIKKIESKLKA